MTFYFVGGGGLPLPVVTTTQRNVTIDRNFSGLSGKTKNKPSEIYKHHRMVEFNKDYDEGSKSCDKLHYTLSAFVTLFYCQSIVRIFYN